MSKDGIIFIICLFVLATFAGKLSFLIGSIVGLVFFWVLIINILKHTRKNVNNAAFLLPVEKVFGVNQTMSVTKLSPSLEAAEEQIMSRLHAPGDDHATLNRRYAMLIGVCAETDPLPAYYGHLIAKRILFAYHKKYGDVNKRFFTPFRLSIEEAVAPIEKTDILEFNQFCLKQTI